MPSNMPSSHVEGAAVTEYRCYFLREDGKINHAEEFTARDDPAAIATARQTFSI